jgi:hypothetical protein
MPKTEDFLIVENGKLIHYKRTGECNHCGDCCGNSLYDINKSVKAISKSTVKRNGGHRAPEGWSIFFSQGVWWYMKTRYEPNTRGRCKHHGDSICRIWEDRETLPVLCTYWPIHPKDIEMLPRCGYKFTEVNE